jgi:hypothetical protein
MKQSKQLADINLNKAIIGLCGKKMNIELEGSTEPAKRPSNTMLVAL